MGIYEREYYQEESDGIRIGGRWSVVTILVAINVAFFLLNALIPNDALNSFMSLKGSLFQEPWRFYELITHGFAHASITSEFGFMHLGMNMFGLWMFGRQIEVRYGGYEFLRLYIVSVLFCGFVWVANAHFSGHPMDRVVGASGAVTTVVILFCLLYPKQMVYLMGIVPIPAWAAGLLIIMMNIFGHASSAGRVAYDAHLAGAAFAFAYFYLNWNFARIVPDRMLIFPKWKGTPALKIHEPNPASEWEEAEKAYVNRDEEADRVLQKLHTQGEDSLSPSERKILEDYSRRMRQKHR
ncbi:MAG: membrane associated rhomboid family serine protease [Pirellulaceae bacterium]|jgi:membrane associated rhomboid family serine protease